LLEFGGGSMECKLIPIILFLLIVWSHTVYGLDRNEQKMKIIAHRGDSANAPENTIAAYELAKKKGANYIELDLGMTKDGNLIAIHDNKVDRITDGSGQVNSFRLSQIKRLDAGSWFNKQHPEKAKPLYSQMKLSSLEEIIGYFGKSVNYYIEIKTPKEYPGMTVELLRILNKHHLIGENENQGKVIIESSSSDSLKYIHEKYPSVVLIQLSTDARAVNLAKVATYADGVGPLYTTVTKNFIQNAHQQGLIVHCWTVNNEVDMNKLKAWKADGLFTDNVELATEVLNK